MRLNPEDPFIEHIVLLTNMDEKSRSRLIEDAENHFGSPWGLALRDFFALSKHDLSYIGLTKETEINASVRQYMWMQSFSECVRKVGDILVKLTPPMTEEARQANEHCMKMDGVESALIFTRKYFGLRNFTEAEQITLSDFIVAKKDAYNTAMFQYAINDIQRKKFAKK